MSEERWSGTVDEAIEVVREYLIGGTAKDCSVFISIFSLKKFALSAVEDFKALAGGEYAYRVRVVDLVSSRADNTGPQTIAQDSPLSQPGPGDCRSVRQEPRRVQTRRVALLKPIKL